MIEIRPMNHGDDIEAVYEMASAAFASREEVLSRTPEEIERRLERYRGFLRHDPEGCWVAADTADKDGKAVGVAIGLRRERLWILSLFVVEEGYRGGVGRGLLEKALECSEGLPGAMIASSIHPAAMRRYSLAGFDLHPTFTASGVVERSSIPSDLSVREGDESDLELAADVDRSLRGSSHGPDLEYMVSSGDVQLLVCERGSERGYAVVGGDSPRLVAATRPEVASNLLWAALAAAEPGKESEVCWITGQQNWAVRVALAARLSLKPDGPICTRGEIGPLHPYLPSGPYV